MSEARVSGLGSTIPSRGSFVLMGGLKLSVVLGITVAALLWVSGGEGLTDEAVAVLPWLCLALAAYLCPLLVAPGMDIASPVSVVGLRAAISMCAIIAAVATKGEASFSALGPLGEEERIELARQVAILHIVAQGAYVAGYYASSGNFVSRLFPPLGRHPWHGGRVVAAIALLTCMGAVFFAIFQQKSGGGMFDITNLGRGKELIRSNPSLSWLVRGVQLLLLPVLLLACVSIASRSIPALLLTVAFLGVAGILVTRMGQRGPAFMAAATVVGLFHLMWRRIPISVGLALILGAAVVSSWLGQYRSQRQAEVNMVADLSDPVQTAAEHEDERHRLTVLGVIMHTFPERHDYLMGETYKGFLVWWIPRWVWPEKTEFMRWSDTAIVYRISGLPAPTPLPGALYANFSWFGVAFGMALFGAFHRGLYRFYQKSPQHPGVCLLYVATLGVFTPTLLGISYAVQTVAPLVFVSFLISKRSDGRFELSAPHA